MLEIQIVHQNADGFLLIKSFSSVFESFKSYFLKRSKRNLRIYLFSMQINLLQVFPQVNFCFSFILLQQPVLSFLISDNQFLKNLETSGFVLKAYF